MQKIKSKCLANYEVVSVKVKEESSVAARFLLCVNCRWNNGQEEKSLEDEVRSKI